MDEGLIGGLFGLAILGGMMHCLGCGNQIKNNSKSCPHCGKKF